MQWTVRLETTTSAGKVGLTELATFSPPAAVRRPSAGLKQVIGNGLRSRTDQGRAAEVGVAAYALGRMPGLGRPISTRIA